MTKERKKRSKPNKALTEALGQVVTYLHSCDKQNVRDILKPKAFIVIGKERTDKARERRVFTSYINNIEIITYTELLKRGDMLLSYIKSVSQHA